MNEGESMNDLIKVAVVLAMAAVSTHKLPTVLKTVRKAQIQVLRESRTSSWGKAWVPSK
jgi:hypothetical protein